MFVLHRGQIMSIYLSDSTVGNTWFENENDGDKVGEAAAVREQQNLAHGRIDWPVKVVSSQLSLCHIKCYTSLIADIARRTKLILLKTCTWQKNKINSEYRNTLFICQKNASDKSIKSE